MRKWSKKIGVVAGGLIGLGGLLNPVAAQFGAPAPQGGGMFAGDPQPPMPADFPNPARGGSEPISPFSLRDDGAPNAFTVLEGAPSTTPPYILTFRGEWLNWWMDKIHLPGPLVTTSTNPLTDAIPGALGQPGTAIVLPAGDYSYGAVGGGRATLGIASGVLPPIETTGFWFNKNLTIFNAGSTGNLPLYIPVQTPNQTNIAGIANQSAYVIASPAVGAGSINILDRFNLWGIDVNMLIPLTDNGTIQFDGVVGYRYAQLSESLRMSSGYQATVPTTFNGQVIPGGFPVSIVDEFSTRNEFNGGTIGIRNRLTWSQFTLMTDANIALGVTHQTLNVGGTSQLSGGTLIGAGILALPSNSGLTTRQQFAAIPEVNMTLSCQLTPNIRVFGGYNLFWWTNVIRPADQISTSVDVRQVPIDRNFVPGFVGNAPVPSFSTTSFFAHGVSVGVEIGF
jgi:hypothetical protein